MKGNNIYKVCNHWHYVVHGQWPMSKMYEAYNMYICVPVIENNGT